MADQNATPSPPKSRPLTDEVVRSLYGAYRLARGDRTALSWFNPTLEGFWRSFMAAALILPLFAGLRMLSYANETDPGTLADPLRIVLVEGLAYVVAWVVFPLAMIYVTRLLGVDRHFFKFMTAYNWAMVWQNLVYMTVAYLSLGGLLPPELAAFLSLVVIVGLFIYSWFIATVTLEVPPGTAAAVVVFDFLLGLFLHGLTDKMLVV